MAHNYLMGFTRLKETNLELIFSNSKLFTYIYESDIKEIKK